jgi:hypothetical protein
MNVERYARRDTPSTNDTSAVKLVLVGSMATADDAGADGGRDEGHADGREYAREARAVVMAEGAGARARRRPWDGGKGG